MVGGFEEDESTHDLVGEKIGSACLGLAEAHLFKLCTCRVPKVFWHPKHLCDLRVALASLDELYSGDLKTSRQHASNPPLLQHATSSEAA